MDATNQNLLFYTSIRSLSRGNVVKTFSVLRSEMRQFLGKQHKEDLVTDCNDDAKLAYLVDVFSKLNMLNLRLLDRNHLMMDMLERS